jgi:hypothetical protein
MSYAYKWIAVLLSFTLVFHVTIQPIAASPSPARDIRQVKAPTYGDQTDSDEDGIPDLEEGRRGMNPNQPDTDFDKLEDKWELDNGLDPLDPDKNDDGLPDYQEIVLEGELDLQRDSDGDGYPNIDDEDNDNDGVPDGLDMSPFSRSEVNDTFSFHIQTEGNPTYFNISVRPENPEHLSLPDRAWDWPFDEQAQMQDMDHTREDIEIIPVLEFSAEALGEIIPDDDAAKYGISISGDTAYVPLSPVKDEGRTVALTGKLFLPASEAALDVELEAGLVWMIQGTTDKSDLNWSDFSDTEIGKYHQGGGSAFVDLNGNGKPEILMLAVDNPAGANNLRYRIGWDMNGFGEPDGGWGSIRQVSPDDFSYHNAGGGLAAGDIDGNGRPDLLLMGIDDSRGRNEFRYVIGWNLDEDGNVDSWSDFLEVPGVGAVTDGGGACLFDFGGDGRLDLVLMGIDNPEGENEFRYRIGWDLDASGKASGWSYTHKIAKSGLGHSHAGGGAAIGDLDGNGWPEMVFMAIDDPKGPNHIRYVIGWNLSNAGVTDSWGDVLSVSAMGNATAGGGSAVADLNGNGAEELLFMTVDDPEGQNEFRYRIGWDIDSRGVPAEQWSGELRIDDFALGYHTDGGGSAVGDIDGNGIPDILHMWIDNPGGTNAYRYRIGWDIDEEGRPTRGWTGFTVPMQNPGSSNAGAGAALGDIDGNGVLDLVVMGIDDPDGENHFRYQVGWNLAADGYAASWTDTIEIAATGNRTQGGGVVLGDVNGNGSLDLLVMAVDDPDGENEFRYRMGWDLDEVDGTASGWSDIISIVPEHMAHNHAGGGVSMGDINGNGRPDLVLAAADDRDGRNDFQYIVAWDLAEDGIPQNPSEMAHAPGIGNKTSGGGAVLWDLDEDGLLDVLFMGVDNPDRNDQFRYRMQYRIGAGNWSFPVHTTTSVDIGIKNAGGGVAVADIDGNDVPDIVMMAIEDEDGPDDFLYRIGWNLNSDGLPGKWEPIRTAPAVGNKTEGGGIAVGDVNDNGVPDLLLLAVDNPDGANHFRYQIGWDLDEGGNPSSWGNFIESPANLSDMTAGGSLAIGYIDDNDIPDLVLGCVFSQSEGGVADETHYQIAWNLDGAGSPAEWSPLVKMPSMGNETQGAGASLADLNANGSQELVLMGVDNPDGGNAFRYRIGWDLDENGEPTHWSRTIESAKAQIYRESHGGGAAIADVTGDGELDLVLMAVDDLAKIHGFLPHFFFPEIRYGDEFMNRFNEANRFHYMVGESIQTEPTILARHKEPFLVTGFSVQENLGSEVGVFHDSGDRDKTIRGHVYLHYNYLNSRTTLSDAFADMKEDPYNLTLQGSITYCSHQDEALETSSEKIRDVLEDHPEETEMPVIVAMTDKAADMRMADFNENDDVLVAQSAFAMDLTQRDPVTTHSLKLPWYDATTLDESEEVGCIPFSVDDLIDLVENWGFTDGEEEAAAKHLVTWDIGEMRITEIGNEDACTDPPQDETSDAMTWVQRGLLSFAALATLPSRWQGTKLFYKSWRKAGSTLKQAARAGRSFYRTIHAGKAANLALVEKIKGPLSRSFLGKMGKFSRASKFLKAAGTVVAVGVVAYTFFTIYKQQDGSDFGLALGGVTAGFMVFYFGMLALIACIPFVGAVLSGLIVLSDLVVGAVKGEGWSQMVMEAIIDELVDVYQVTGVDLQYEKTWTEVADADGNGLTPGDTFTFGAKVRAIAYEEEDASSGNIEDTYLSPTFRLESAEGKTDHTRDRYNVINYGDRRWDLWELETSLIPERETVNLKATLHFSADYRVVYRECLASSCDDEYMTDSFSSESDIYLDVLPGDLQGFLSWHEISDVNTNPWAEPDEYEMDTGTVLDVSALDGLMANDSDIDGDTLTVEVAQAPEKGDLSVKTNDGSFRYQVKPENEPFSGQDSFTYTVRDGNGGESREAIVLITVHRENTQPEASNDSFTLEEDAEGEFEVLANDTDADGDALRIRAVSQPAHGSIEIDGDRLAYTPEKDWHGEISFKYVLGDGEDPAESYGVVSLTVTPVDDAPVGGDDQYSLDEDQELNVGAPGLLGNDEDAEGAPLHVDNYEQPMRGTVAVDANGSFTYTPAANFYGEDAFYYQVSDGGQLSGKIKVSLQVAPVDDPPVAVDDTYATIEDRPLTRSAADGMLANDSDPDDDLSVEMVEGPGVGSLSIRRHDGYFHYVPEKDYTGSVTWKYKAVGGSKESEVATVTVTVVEDHNNPLAVDDHYVLDNRQTLSVYGTGVLENDLAALTFTDLGLSENCRFTDIGASGQVAGFSVLSDGTYEGLFYDGAGFERFRVWGMDITKPGGINDQNIIAGFGEHGSDGAGFLATPPGTDWTFQRIDYPGADKTYTLGINDDGDYCGSYEAGGSRIAYWHDGSVYNDFSVAGASATWAEGMDNSGRIVGYYEKDGALHGYLHDPGPGTTDFVDVEGGSDTRLYGISENGVMAGTYSDVNGIERSIVCVNNSAGFSFAAIPTSWACNSAAGGVNADGSVSGWKHINPDPASETRGYVAESHPENAAAYLVAGPEHGDLTLNADGSFIYTLTDPCFEGTDEFTYTADDGSDISDPARVVIEVRQADTDGDGTRDCQDPDDDNDGIPDGEDNCPRVPNSSSPDNQIDSDGDGVGDACDNCNLFPNPGQADTDDDGKGDLCDTCTDADGDGECDFDPDCIDVDGDGVCAKDDNCPFTYNPDQANLDEDEFGDACDVDLDIDEDGVYDPVDNCPGIYNPGQEDVDNDNIGDACEGCLDVDQDSVCGEADNCPLNYNPDQADTDGDGVGDACDDCTDTDADLVCDRADNCRDIMNPTQDDSDGDGIGDACDSSDTDADGISDAADNCPAVPNSGQADTDGDGIGDACDPCMDSDGDSICDGADNCPEIPNSGQIDTDGDGRGDLCDTWTDFDKDGVADVADNCPLFFNPYQTDADEDGVGDVCDPCVDQDGDGLCSEDDNCDSVSNPDQADMDGDGIGDACDPCTDTDADGICDADDNCPDAYNPDQADEDFDDRGDVCETCVDEDGDGVCGYLEDNVLTPSAGNGDGNGDGTPDRLQSQIASLPVHDRSAYVTLGVFAPGCVLKEVAADSGAALDAPPDLYFPHGFFSFEIHGVSAGQQVQVKMFIPRDETVTGYYKRNVHTGQWQDIAGAVDHHSVPGKTVIAFALTEGGSFDADASISTITDPGGPVSSRAAPIPTMTEWGMLLLAILLALSGIAKTRRKRYADLMGW